MARTTCILAISLLLAHTAHAASVAASRASDVVTLRNSGLAACPSGGTAFDQRMLADGTADIAFAVPEGRVLVITGLDWRVINATPNQITGAGLRVDIGSTTNTVFFDTAVADAGGGAGRAVAIPAVVVKPGVQVCLGISGPGGPVSGMLHGFLVKDR